MSFEPPEGILDIGNATLRVGKLEVAETSGLNQGLQNIIKNDLLITENTEYSINHKWGLKLPTTWVAEFEVKGHSGKYIDFNFYNENSASNAQGYNLTFMDTSLTLRYDGGSALGGGAATIPTIVGAYRKVNIFFERGVISVSIDGTRYLYHKETDGFNQGLGVASRVVSTTGSAFVNLFIESDNENNSKFKNLRIVNGRFISDKTSNIAFIGGNLGVGVNSPKEALDIRGNMHLTRVSNVSQIKVESNVVTEYTGPHDRPLRKYPEVALTSASHGGYVANASSSLTASQPYINFDGNLASHWHSRHPYYSTSTGAYSPGTAADGQSPTGTLTTNQLISTSLGGDSHQGEWVSIELPKKIKLEKLKVIGSTRLATVYQFPKDVVVAVSETGLTGSWSALETATLISQNVSNHSDTINITTQTAYYKYFALIVKSISTAGLHSAVEIAELEFYGHEEGSGSLDTTLKSVYNVPATTGTQLEVYYDAKDLAEMPNTVTDLSPNTNTGALSTSPPTLDETDGIKSFKFDASSSQRITSTIDTSYWGTNKVHSVSFWFKADSVAGKFNVFQIGNYASFEASGFWVSDGSADSNAGNSLNWWHIGQGSRIKQEIFSWSPNTWYHIALTFDGSTKKLYVNGKHIYFSNGNVITTLPTGIPNSASLAVGSTTNSADYFDGSIANFRVYGAKTLNAGQVQELYDYQKDYFLGSKSQVTLYKGHLGVGVTEPSGQLELAGDERLQEYPPGPMGPSTSYETLIPGHGVFCWNTVNYYPGSPVENYNGSGMYAKDGATTGWYGPYNGHNGYTGGNVYAGTDFAATSSSGLGFNDAYGTRYYGAWTTFKLPYKINLKKIHIDQFGTSDNVNTRCVPEDGVILGSNNGSEWYHVHTFTGLQYGGTAGTSSYSAAGEDVTITCNTDYSQYALVVTRTLHYAFTAMIGELRWFGTPGPTTLDKGSLSLTRSLDVPRVSRYDVDTETPRPEKLVVDFDTTVNSSPTDISGKGNHGTFYGDAQYSAADKAFKFDGNSDYIRTTPLGFSGDQVHSVSLWFWSDVEQSTFGLNEHGLWGTGGLSNSTETGLSMYNTFVQVWRASGATRYPMTFNANQWNHLCMAYSSGGSINSRLWLNGVELTQDSSVTSTSAYSFQASEYLVLGTWINNTTPATSYPWDGQISNPKIYNVALEPSEVRKLYNLGRTGRSMVISDTAVGIGKAPEAQLDVRGNLNVDGVITTPQRPVFYAYHAADGGFNHYTDNGDTGLIRFKNTRINVGNCFNTSDYKFYAPITGYYWFEFSALAREGSAQGHVELTLFRNGANAAQRSFAYAYVIGNDDHDFVAVHVPLFCNAGDNVYPAIHDCAAGVNIYFGEDIGHFSGYFIG